jgi:GNAT superfamily N-acetyltransferase
MTQIRPDLRLIFENDPSPELRRAIGKKIDDFNARTVPYQQERFAFVLRGAADRLHGGITGILYWEWLFIDDLWIDDPWRGQGLGRELMNRAEAHALGRGCHSAWLDTFQAQGFYEKLGYTVFGALEDYPAGQRRSFLKKRLAGQAPVSRG